ncbi:MAG: T9SS type A sorting domain-containing protein [Candidatus Latescibacterota bacterium]|nr:MAG: T9SS type A sorting domain-containing protein [Candidatus Latescibacterota bacterium]
MRDIAILLTIIGLLSCLGGDAICEDIYFEGWEGGTTGGWEANDPASVVSVGTSGGNPGGYLGIQGESQSSVRIGALTTIPEATGDYWASGVGTISFDVRLVSGWYFHVWLRICGVGSESKGWLYRLPNPYEVGSSWSSVTIGLDSAWDDSQADLAGWFRERGALGFHETMANVGAVEILCLAMESVDVRIDNFRLGPTQRCYEDLPDPVVRFKGKSVAGDFLIRWDFEIQNWADYPAEMFLPSPDLPPCGSNRAAPRTKYRFVRSDGEFLASSCGVTNPSMLQDIFFTGSDIGSPNVYVELIDRRCNMVYRSNTVSTVFTNSKPVANAGEDQIVECAGATTPVTLDGSLSSDPDGHDITFEWLVQGVRIDDPTAPVTVGHFPPGTHHVALNVSDGLTQSTDVVEITIVDTTPPDLHVDVNRRVLWPPNHRYFDIQTTVVVDDACGEVLNVVLTNIFSHESGKHGDIPVSDAVRNAQFGTLDTDFELLSERDGRGSGREYGIVYMTLDRAFNLTSDTVYVHVPHDQSGHALAALGFSADGRALKAGTAQYALVVPSQAGRGSHPGFDATTIDVKGSQVGSSRGALSPESAYLGDVDGDGLEDIVLFYPTDETVRLLRLAQDEGDDISFYYRGDAGEIYTVLNIFDLGKPVSIVMADLRPVEGYGDGVAKKDPRLELRLSEPSRRVEASLDRAYPNPFNPNIVLTYSLSVGGVVRLDVFDVNGRLVRRVTSGERPAGSHTVSWDAHDDSGIRVSSGVYFARLQFKNVTQTRKIVLLK